MTRLRTALFAAAAASLLAGCGDNAHLPTSPPAMARNPELPAPQKSLIPH